ncbi:MAG: hypothetical protein HY906_02685 [Deltaproteobacteria bacterium]|nr:hypothetical protein [Deltaproteobacteria bacterium]
MAAVSQPVAGTAATPGPEWAVGAGVREIRAAEAAGSLRPVDGGWSTTLASGESVLFRRLYAGAEFCRHLIPSRAQWTAVLALARRRRVPVTLRTPPVTEEALARLAIVLRALSGVQGAEVVANDWGTLRLVHRRFPGLRPILGRCLRRQKKDPRVGELAMSGAMSPETLDLLARWGVDLVEADCLPDDASPIALALHLPFAFVASGSLCLLSGLGRPVEEKFRPDRPCRAPCRGRAVRLHHPACRAPLLLRENTFFAARGVGGPPLARPDVARLVYDLDTDVDRSFLRPGPVGRP